MKATRWSRRRWRARWGFKPPVRLWSCARARPTPTRPRFRARSSVPSSIPHGSPSALDVSCCSACTEGVAAACETLELSQPKPVAINEPRVLAVRVEAPLTKSTLLRLVPE